MTHDGALWKAPEDRNEGIAALEVKGPVRRYVQENFFLGAGPNRLDDATPLITGGIVDSIGMIGLVAFLEEKFKIEFLPSEINAQGLDTLDRIETLVRRKLESRPCSGAGT
jgi:acyl carrier protein